MLGTSGENQQAMSGISFPEEETIREGGISGEIRQPAPPSGTATRDRGHSTTAELSSSPGSSISEMKQRLWGSGEKLKSRGSPRTTIEGQTSSPLVSTDGGATAAAAAEVDPAIVAESVTNHVVSVSTDEHAVPECEPKEETLSPVIQTTPHRNNQAMNESVEEPEPVSSISKMKEQLWGNGGRLKAWGSSPRSTPKDKNAPNSVEKGRDVLEAEKVAVPAPDEANEPVTSTRGETTSEKTMETLELPPAATPNKGDDEGVFEEAIPSEESAPSEETTTLSISQMKQQLWGSGGKLKARGSSGDEQPQQVVAPSPTKEVRDIAADKEKVAVVSAKETNEPAGSPSTGIALQQQVVKGEASILAPEEANPSMTGDAFVVEESTPLSVSDMKRQLWGNGEKLKAWGSPGDAKAEEKKATPTEKSRDLREEEKTEKATPSCAKEMKEQVPSSMVEEAPRKESAPKERSDPPVVEATPPIKGDDSVAGEESSTPLSISKMKEQLWGNGEKLKAWGATQDAEPEEKKPTSASTKKVRDVTETDKVETSKPESRSAEKGASKGKESSEPPVATKSPQESTTTPAPKTTASVSSETEDEKPIISVSKMKEQLWGTNEELRAWEKKQAAEGEAAGEQEQSDSELRKREDKSVDMLEFETKDDEAPASVDLLRKQLWGQDEKLKAWETEEERSERVAAEDAEAARKAAEEAEAARRAAAEAEAARKAAEAAEAARKEAEKLEAARRAAAERAAQAKKKAAERKREEEKKAAKKKRAERKLAEEREKKVAAARAAAAERATARANKLAADAKASAEKKKRVKATVSPESKKADRESVKKDKTEKKPTSKPRHRSAPPQRPRATDGTKKTVRREKKIRTPTSPTRSPARRGARMDDSAGYFSATRASLERKREQAALATTDEAPVKTTAKKSVLSDSAGYFKPTEASLERTREQAIARSSRFDSTSRYCTPSRRTTEKHTPESRHYKLVTSRYCTPARRRVADEAPMRRNAEDTNTPERVTSTVMTRSMQGVLSPFDRLYVSDTLSLSGKRVNKDYNKHNEVGRAVNDVTP